MLRWIAALAAASAITPAAFAATSASLSTTAWWERVTVTLTGDGKTQSCRYETSIARSGSKQCEVVGSDSSGAAQQVAARDEFATIIFERRFHPGALQQDDGGIQVGDTLLGRQVMALAIDSGGNVSGCKVVATSGDLTPEYGCEQAKAERFEAKAGQSQSPARQGYMTVLIYGHSEHVA